MRLLVVGGGGREHALAWALHRHDPSSEIFCAPGNPGTAQLANNLSIPADDLDGLVHSAGHYGIDLTIVGPEAPLAAGLADRLTASGHPVFGPTAAGARIEASKAFAKDIMSRAGVPTSQSGTFSDVDEALAYVAGHAEPLVVKASGLAAGKGAVVCATRAEAEEKLGNLLQGDAACGAVREQEAQFLFPDVASIKSAAVVALRHGMFRGVLALGSTNAEHFSPGMDTLFLRFIGEVLSRLLVVRGR
ncbi:MAG: DUF484 family protein [Myxococcales bacterium]|nr:DUF484 family protein [Myxococcales bacterium]